MTTPEMDTNQPFLAPDNNYAQLIDSWAANLALPDVKLAPFMPARFQPPCGWGVAAADRERILRLIKRAQGRPLGIIL